MQFESCQKDKFHVVTCISNPVRYQKRYELYKKFAEHMKQSGVNLHTIELQTGDRPFAITDACNQNHIQVRNWDILWHKENLLNIAISKLPCDWETVAWIDGDVEFVRRDWVEETLHQLQIYQVVQMFETAIDLGPTGQTLAVHKSFMSEYIKGGAFHPESQYHEKHPGFCFAARREAIDGMGGLYERAILGAGDRHMALAFIGKLDQSLVKGMHGAYVNDLKRFEERCEKTIRRDVGFVPGTILHYWHGKKKDRRYFDRWKILIKNKYHPHKDIKKDSYGVFNFHDDGSYRFLRLRDEIRHYMGQRNEDSIDLI